MLTAATTLLRILAITNKVSLLVALIGKMFYSYWKTIFFDRVSTILNNNESLLEKVVTYVEDEVSRPTDNTGFPSFPYVRTILRTAPVPYLSSISILISGSDPDNIKSWTMIDGCEEKPMGGWIVIVALSSSPSQSMVNSLPYNFMFWACICK